MGGGVAGWCVYTGRKGVNSSFVDCNTRCRLTVVRMYVNNFQMIMVCLCASDILFGFGFAWLAEHAGLFNVPIYMVAHHSKDLVIAIINL